MFCSSINRLVGIQYVNTNFGEYFNALSRLMANFTYLGFSICRMSRFGKEHGKFIEYFNDKLSIKKYTGVSLTLIHLPSMITPLNYLRLIALQNPDRSKSSSASYLLLHLTASFSLRVFCSLERGCMLFQSFSNLLFLFGCFSKIITKICIFCCLIYF